MDNRDYFLSIVLPLEGGRSNHPDDRGGLTNKGVTLSLLESIKYDTDGNKIIDARDLFTITYDDIKSIISKSGYYLPDYDSLHPELAFLLTDWAWASGKAYLNKYIEPLRTGFKSYFSTFEVLSILNLIRALFYRQIIKWRPRNATFKAGWYKKMIQTGIRCNLSVNLDSDTILKTFIYDKSNSQDFKF